jgi:hypothetical protein
MAGEGIAGLKAVSALPINNNFTKVFFRTREEVDVAVAVIQKHCGNEKKMWQIFPGSFVKLPGGTPSNSAGTFRSTSRSASQERVFVQAGHQGEQVAREEEAALAAAEDGPLRATQKLQQQQQVIPATFFSPTV